MLFPFSNLLNCHWPQFPSWSDGNNNPTSHGGVGIKWDPPRCNVRHRVWYGKDEHSKTLAAIITICHSKTVSGRHVEQMVKTQSTQHPVTMTTAETALYLQYAWLCPADPEVDSWTEPGLGDLSPGTQGAASSRDQRHGICSPYVVSSHVSYSIEKAGPEKEMRADPENAEGRGKTWGPLSAGGSWSWGLAAFLPPKVAAHPTLLRFYEPVTSSLAQAISSFQV